MVKIKNKTLANALEDLGHCIFIDYSKDIIQYMILDSDKLGMLPLNEKLPSKFAHVNRDFLLSCKLNIKDPHKLDVVPSDILEFLVDHNHSKVFISKNSQKHLPFKKSDFSSKLTLSNQTLNNVLAIKAN